MPVVPDVPDVIVSRYRVPGPSNRDGEPRPGLSRTATGAIQVGVRQRVAENLVLSAGVGFGVGDEAPDARIIVGVQRSFGLF